MRSGRRRHTPPSPAPCRARGRSPAGTRERGRGVPQLVPRTARTPAIQGIRGSDTGLRPVRPGITVAEVFGRLDNPAAGTHAGRHAYPTPTPALWGVPGRPGPSRARFLASLCGKGARPRACHPGPTNPLSSEEVAYARSLHAFAYVDFDPAWPLLLFVQSESRRDERCCCGAGLLPIGGAILER